MEIKTYSTVKIGTEKSFGKMFSIFFIFLGLYFYTKIESIFSIFLFTLSIFILIFSFVKPSIFKIPNLLWSKLGILLGMIVSPIILFIIFIFLIIQLVYL